MKNNTTSNFEDFIEEQSGAPQTLVKDALPLSDFEVFLKDIYDPMISDQELIERVRQNPQFVQEVTEKGFSALIHAGFAQPYVRKGNDDFRTHLSVYLIEQGANVNQASVEMGWTPLIANINNTKVALLLLEKGANPNTSLKEGGLSPLTAASTKGNIKIVKSLIDHNVSMQWSRSAGWSPLLSAASFSDVELLTLLVQNIEKDSLSEVVNFQGSAKMSALHIAARSGNLEGLKLLVNSGGNLFLENALGMNALHLASKGGHTQVVEYLLQKGLDPLASDREGFCAIDYAQLQSVKDLFGAYDLSNKKPHPLPLKKGKTDAEQMSEQIEKNASAKVGKTLKRKPSVVAKASKEQRAKAVQTLIESQVPSPKKERKNTVKKSK